MVDAYARLAALGHAHSVEAWADDALVGGLYGVAIGRMFFGESMFSRRQRRVEGGARAPGRASSSAGDSELIDCQMSTSHLASLGAREIPRAEFLDAVRTAGPAAGRARRRGGSTPDLLQCLVSVRQMASRRP